MPKLTVGAVEKYRPQKARREIWDTTPGLVLVIQPKTGTKTWALRVRRPSGKLAKLTLGPYIKDACSDAEPAVGAPLTLVQARQLANKLAHERALGHDIVAENAARKARQRAEHQDLAANTFGAAVRQFFIEYKTKHKERPRRWHGDARLLGLRWPRGCDPAKVAPEVAPGSLAAMWADKPVAEIDAHDIYVTVDDARRRNIPGIKARNSHISDARGRKMHAALSQLFRSLLRQRRVSVNPCVGVWHGDPPKARERTLNDVEIAKFWRATENVDELFRGALRTLALTGCRLAEVAGMRRDELSADGKVWTIPAARVKNHREHQLPLSPLAQQVLSAVPNIENAAGLFFTTNARRPISGWSKIKKQLDTAMGKDVPPWRIHDLRRTVATGMAELGVAPHIIEATLNHVSGHKGGVAGVYNRAAYAPEKKLALERWSRHVEGLLAADKNKVVSFKRGRRK